MKKENGNFKFVSGFIAGIIVASATVVGANQAIQAIQNTEIKVSLNGQVQTFKDETTNETQYPITYHDRTYLPLRNVAQLTGLKVDYDNNSKTAILSKAYSNSQLIEFAKAHLKITTGYVPSLVDVQETKDNTVMIHLYDLVDDHTSTVDWYTVNRYTGKGTNVLNENIDISPENIIRIINNNSSTKDDKRNQIYQSLLMNFYFNNQLPDISEIDVSINDAKGKSEDKFVIFDVDKDGKDELILSHYNSSMAGMFQVIYDYNEKMGTVTSEYFGTPVTKFYENGFVDVNVLHNQGKAFLFMWPYNIYKYDFERDQYIEFAYISGWDKRFNDEFSTYAEEKFPIEIDKDNDGGIYEVFIGENKQYMDSSEFEKWLNDNCGELVELGVPFVSLTEENIREIGN